MITDRISLNVSLKYLDQFEQNDGKVIDILFSRKENDKPRVSSVKFEDIDTLKSYIKRYTPITTFKDYDCSPLAHFELKMFTVLKNNTDKNLIYFDTGEFKGKARNITPAVLENLNLGYLKEIAEVRNAFNSIMVNEYILTQHDYIDCGYIEIYFPEAIEIIKKLYNKYK